MRGRHDGDSKLVECPSKDPQPEKAQPEAA